MKYTTDNVDKELKKRAVDLRKIALAYPEAVEEHPWGENAFKVKAKVFLFMGVWDQGLSLSVKLPISGEAALALPFAEPTGYGLGKSGWVSARFPPGEDVPMDLVREWVDESYRAIAPKKLVAQLGGGAASDEPAPRRARPAATRRRQK